EAGLNAAEDVAEAGCAAKSADFAAGEGIEAGGALSRRDRGRVELLLETVDETAGRGREEPLRSIVGGGGALRQKRTKQVDYLLLRSFAVFDLIHQQFDFVEVRKCSFVGHWPLGGGVERAKIFDALLKLIDRRGLVEAGGAAGDKILVLKLFRWP